MSTVNVLKTCSLFKELSDREISKVSAISRIRSFEKGSLIFTQGDAANGFYFIVSGAVRIFQLSQKGREQLLHVFSAGQTFGEAAAFGEGTFPACAEAMEKSELIFIPAKGFKELLERTPQLAIKMISSLSNLLHALVDKIEALTLKDARTRLAEYLTDLARPAGGRMVAELRLKKGELASELGMKQETLSRALKHLRAEKIITVEGKRIIVEDMEALKRSIPASA